MKNGLACNPKCGEASMKTQCQLVFHLEKQNSLFYVSAAVNESIPLLKKLEKYKMGKRVVISRNCLTLTLSPWNK